MAVWRGGGRGKLSGVSRTEDDDKHSGMMKRHREYISPHSHKLSINSSRYSVVGEWARLASIPLSSMRTPTVMDGAADSHTWSDTNSFGVMFCSVASTCAAAPLSEMVSGWALDLEWGWHHRQLV